MSSVTAGDLWDRIRGELVRIEDRLTTEISAVRGDLVRIDNRLSTEISAVRSDFAHVLRTELGGIRSELREFRYGRLDAQAMEHQALSAAVARLEQRGAAP